MGTNKSYYSNPSIDKLLDDNIREADPAKRDAAVKQMQQILLDDAAWGLLWYDSWARVMRSDLVGIEKLWEFFRAVRPDEVGLVKSGAPSPETE